MSFFEILRKIPIVDFIAVRIRWAMAADEKRPTMFQYELECQFGILLFQNDFKVL